MDINNRPTLSVTSEEMHKALLQHIAERTGRTYEEVLAEDLERIQMETEVNEKLAKNGFILKPGQTWGDKWIVAKEVALLLSPFYSAYKVLKEAREGVLPFGSYKQGTRWYFDKEGVLELRDKIQKEAQERTKSQSADNHSK